MEEKAVEVIREEEQTAIEYEDLTDPNLPLIEEFSLNSFYELTQTYLHSFDWRVVNNGFLNLRCLSKYYFNFLAPKLFELHEQTLEGVENLRSLVSRSALQFVSELFLHTEIRGEELQFLQMYAPQIIPTIFTKSIVDKKFLSTLAEEAINNLKTNCICKESILAITQLLHIKNSQISDKAAQCLETMISSTEDLKSSILPIMDLFMKEMAKEQNSGRSKIKSSSEHIFQRLSEILGEDVLLNIKEGIIDLTLKEKGILKEFIMSKEKKLKGGAGDFKAFLKKKQIAAKEGEGNLGNNEDVTYTPGHKSKECEEGEGEENKKEDN